ncbi:MAG: type II secretion system protein [Planctomycetota bacterium]|nr:MAG: type II secretion system protein [Planctomycetota bacterium]
MNLRNLNKGFTMLESMIAIIFLSVGIMALLAALSQTSNLAFLAQDREVGSRAASIALEYLRGYKDWQNLYLNFKDYQQNYVSPTQGPFPVLKDGSIPWGQHIDPANPPAKINGLDVVGYGWLEFVTNEQGYDPAIWGTETALNNASWNFDLDGDGVASAANITVGRTAGTTAASGYYITLPVRIVVRIYNRLRPGETGNEVEIESKTFLMNNYEK